MSTCPDCIAVDEHVKGDSRYEVIDIGSHIRYLKEFLRLRDNSPVFDDAKKHGYAGVPCFLLEDGTVTLSPEEAGIHLDDAPWQLLADLMALVAKQKRLNNNRLYIMRGGTTAVICYYASP